MTWSHEAWFPQVAMLSPPRTTTRSRGARMMQCRALTLDHARGSALRACSAAICRMPQTGGEFQRRALRTGARVLERSHTIDRRTTRLDINRSKFYNNHAGCVQVLLACACTSANRAHSGLVDVSVRSRARHVVFCAAQLVAPRHMSYAPAVCCTAAPCRSSVRRHQCVIAFCS